MHYLLYKAPKSVKKEIFRNVLLTMMILVKKIAITPSKTKYRYKGVNTHAMLVTEKVFIDIRMLGCFVRLIFYHTVLGNPFQI